jgi:hypothetical protein
MKVLSSIYTQDTHLNAFFKCAQMADISDKDVHAIVANLSKVPAELVIQYFPGMKTLTTS